MPELSDFLQQQATEEIVTNQEQPAAPPEAVQENTEIFETETISSEEALPLVELFSEDDQEISELVEPSDFLSSDYLEITLDTEEELDLEIPEAVDEGLLIIKRDPSAFEFTDQELKLVELAQPAIEIEEEIKQAALLWAEQWGNENEDVLYEASEQPQEIPLTIIDILPIEPAELAEKLETIPEERLEEASAILDIVLKTMSDYEKQENVEPTELEIITSNLERMVERLLVCLEIEHSEKHVAIIVQALLSGEIKLDFEDVIARQDEGTHERKYVSAWIMAVLKQRATPKPVDHSFIGKFVIQLSFLETQFNWAA